MWIDPEDDNHCQLFIYEALNNISEAKMKLTSYGFTHLMLHYTYGTIETALKTFHVEGRYSNKATWESHSQHKYY